MSWKEQLSALWGKPKRVAILGIGSILCGDDAAGMLLIEQLEADLPPRENVLLMGGSTAPECFTGLIRKHHVDLLLLVDAAFLGKEVGEIALIDRREIDSAGFSTHMLPLSVMLDYLEAEIGCQIVLIGIQPGDTEFATEPCGAILKTVKELSNTLVSLIQR